MRNEASIRSAHAAIVRASQDPSPYMHIVTAETLSAVGDASDQKQGLAVLAELGNPRQQNLFVVMAALNSLDALGSTGATTKSQLPLGSTFQRDPGFSLLVIHSKALGAGQLKWFRRQRGPVIHG